MKRQKRPSRTKFFCKESLFVSARVKQTTGRYRLQFYKEFLTAEFKHAQLFLGRTFSERRSIMFNSGSRVRTLRLSPLHPSYKRLSLWTPALALLLVAGIIAGCNTKQEQAMNQAREQAAKTGQPQQVVSVDKTGTTTTTIVQPPAPGETNEAITTTTTPPSAGTPDPPPSGPMVSAVPQPPPAPVNLTIPAGTRLTIRVDQRISVKHSHEGDRFTGEIVEPVRSLDNIVVVPRGTPVAGVVAVAHRRGHFKGRSLLELRLTSMTLNGKRYPLTTDDLSESKKGKGKRSTALIAGGSSLGMLVGGVATGGVGLVVGGLAGSGVGTATAGLTGNRDIVIPAESIVRFKLAERLRVQPV
jgi:hypothetical protein